MNDSLERFAREIGLGDPARQRLRLVFGRECVRRVEHLLEEPEVRDCLTRFAAYLQQPAGAPDALESLAAQAARLANQHQGSKSIDGCGHAAVSATYAVAMAIAGKALEAASYAAYATVYAQGGAGAVAHRESFQAEFDWQVGMLRQLVRNEGPATSKQAEG